MVENKHTLYRLGTAFIIARQRNTRVLFVLTSYSKLREAVENIMCVAEDLKGFVYESKSSRFVCESGGVVQLTAVSEYNDAIRLGGYIVTHLFIDEPFEYDAKTRVYLEDRVRSTHKFDTTYPIGTYFPWGAKVFIDY